MTTLFAIAVAQVPAHADYTGYVLYLCDGNEVQNFTPPLTSQVVEHDIHVQAALSCFPHQSAGNENFTHLSYDYTIQDIPLGCTAPLIVSLGTIKLVWHYATDPLNRGNSTFRFERTATSANGNVVYSTNGDITDGMFQGSEGVGEATILAADQLTDCLAGGEVDKLSGPAFLDVVKVL